MSEAMKYSEKYINFTNRKSTMQYRPRIHTTITAIVAAFSMVVFFYTPVVAAGEKCGNKRDADCAENEICVRRRCESAGEPPYFFSPTQTSQGDPQQWTSMEENITFAHDTQAIMWTSKDPDAVDDGLDLESRYGIAHSYVSYRALDQLDWSTETETIFNSDPGFFGMWSWVYPVKYISANGVYEIKLISEDADGFRCEEVYTIEVDIDSDQDGYADEVDSCPATPNGPLAGTCYNYLTQESWGSCMTDTECQDAPSEWYTWCDTFQNDLDNNGTGDVCED
jgi:hypothetical protein